MKIIEITWVDACYHDGNCTAEELKTLMDCETVGYFVKEDDDSLSLAMEYSAEINEWKHSISIPKVLIGSRKTLKSSAK